MLKKCLKKKGINISILTAEYYCKHARFMIPSTNKFLFWKKNKSAQNALNCERSKKVPQELVGLCRGSLGTTCVPFIEDYQVLNRPWITDCGVFPSAVTSTMWMERKLLQDSRRKYWSWLSNAFGGLICQESSGIILSSEWYRQVKKSMFGYCYCFL